MEPCKCSYTLIQFSPNQFKAKTMLCFDLSIRRTRRQSRTRQFLPFHAHLTSTATSAAPFCATPAAAITPTMASPKQASLRSFWWEIKHWHRFYFRPYMFLISFWPITDCSFKHIVLFLVSFHTAFLRVYSVLQPRSTSIFSLQRVQREHSECQNRRSVWFVKLFLQETDFAHDISRFFPACGAVVIYTSSFNYLLKQRWVTL